MTYPIKVRKWGADHRGGTKSYFLVLVTNADGNSLLITRFGKKGSWGQVTVKPEKQYAAASNFEATRSAKSAKGYERNVSDTTTEASDLEDLKKKIGPQYWTKLGAANVEWVAPDADTSAIKEPDAPIEWQETADGKFIPKEREPLKFKEADPTFEERVAQNPNWGMFS